MDEPTPPAPSVTSYFSGLAEAYERYRPSYPPRAIDAVIEAAGGGSPRLADVGCGTGISSRLLSRRGARVVGIEPNPDMLRVARETGADAGEEAGSLAYREGTAEGTGLDDRSVDGVVCAQSFHWFDAKAALAEFHRITREGGIVALMWNVRDEAESAASRAYEELVSRAQGHARASGRVLRQNREGDAEAGGFFVGSRQLVFENPVRYTRDALRGRLHSASYYPREGAAREELDARIDELFLRHAEEGAVELAQSCHLTIATRALARPAQ